MSLAAVESLVQMIATGIGILGGSLALFKYFSDKRETELREWQKVVIYRIFRQNEKQAMRFTEILEKYRSEAQAFADVDLTKKEIGEDALRRVLLELTGSGILGMEPMDSFRLRLPAETPDPVGLFHRINAELVDLVSPNPFVYTLDDILKQISPRVNVPIPLLRTNFRQALAAGNLVADEQGRIAFPR